MAKTPAEEVLLNLATLRLFPDRGISELRDRCMSCWIHICVPTYSSYLIGAKAGHKNAHKFGQIH